MAERDDMHAGVSTRLLTEILDALKRRRAETSLRGVAREVDLSPTGLSQLLDGATPYGKTVRKLLTWYASYQKSLGNLDAAADGAIAVLLSRVPQERHEEARAALLRVLKDFSRRAV